MKPIALFISLFFGICFTSFAQKSTYHSQFENELAELKAYFQIPGLAVQVIENKNILYEDYLGLANIEQNIRVDSTTLFPIASVTKVFSAVLLMKLVEQGKISLDDPIVKYVPHSGIDKSILVKHVLSHTSQGDVGKNFYYSSRFGYLTEVIEKGSGMSLESFIQQRILRPLKLNNTHLFTDSAKVAAIKNRIAQPYFLDNGIENGFFEYGFSASAGVITNLSDLAAFNQALDNNTLISESSKMSMFSSFREGLPYGYGIFHQTFDGLDFVWAYGQYDFYSSLFFKIPSKNITLILLANNNLMSDPARLINGDATSSLFVLSFLKNFIYKLNSEESLDNSKSNSQFHRKTLLSKALSESFMARFDPERLKSSASILKGVFSEYPDYEEYADLNLLHNLVFLKDVAYHMGLGDFTIFDDKIEAIASKLLENDPQSPYVHVYMGSYYDRKGKPERAKYHYTNIIQAENFSKFWYTSEAENWLKNNE